MTTRFRNSIRAVEPTIARRTADKQRLLIWGTLLAIFFLGTALRLYELDADSLWYDEILTARRAQMAVSSVIHGMASGTMGGGTQAPLMYVVTRFLVVLLDTSDFVIRLQALVFGSLSILLAYALGETLWTRGVGLTGAFLLAVNAYHIRFSQEARPYALMVFLALLSLIFLLKALQKNEKGHWIGFVLCTSLGLYNHHFAFLFLPAEVIFGTVVIVENWFSHRGQDSHASAALPSSSVSAPAKQALAFCGSLALIAVLYLPWLPSLRMSTSNVAGSHLRHVSTTTLESSLSYLWSTIGEHSGVQGGALILWAGLFVLGLATAGRRRILLLMLWTVAPFVLASAITSTRFASPKYVLFILPISLLLVARGIASGVGFLGRHLPGIERDRKWLVPFMAGLATLVLASCSVVPIRDYYRTQKTDWRGAARYLADNVRPGDIILVDGKNYRQNQDAPWVYRCLSYYMRSHGMNHIPILQVERGLGEGLQTLGEAGGEVWVVLKYINMPASWKRLPDVVVTDSYARIAILRMQDSSADLAQDATSMLELLLELLPDEARFDVHLALAEIKLHAGEFDRGAFHVYHASLLRPHHPAAWRHLERARAELEQFTEAVEHLPHPAGARLGEVLRFLAYEIHPETMHAGETIYVTLWWQALAEMQSDYTAFIHLVGPDGRVCAQEDRLLEHDGLFTSAWKTGQVAAQQYQLIVPPDAPAGEYVVQAGVYYWETGERLPAWDEHGQRLPKDTILLDPICISD